MDGKYRGVEMKINKNIVNSFSLIFHLLLTIIIFGGFFFFVLYNQ